MMGYGGYGYGMMGYGWGWLMMIGVLIIVILGIFALFRFLQHTNNNYTHSSGSSALNILNERYAKGELSSEEYNKMKSEILK